MKFYVAAFPDLGSHAKWIEEFRGRHDRVAKFVAPHITLVFPTSSLPQEQLRTEVLKLCKQVDPFRVTLRSAMVMPENLITEKRAHIFLVPDEGLGKILRLHDHLYSELLKTELRLDIPFVPHLTVGSGIELFDAKKLADHLNAKNFEITFNLDKISIVEIVDTEADRLVSSPIALG